MPNKHKKKICYCPPKTQAICKAPPVIGSKDIAEIVQALTFEEEAARKRMSKKPKRTKPMSQKPMQIPPPARCPMLAPELYIRSQIGLHCPTSVPPRLDDKTKGKLYGIDMTQIGGAPCGVPTCGMKKKKKVRYDEDNSKSIVLPFPTRVVKHDSKDGILHVPSPKTSGEVIQAQRTTLQSSEYKPPLPPKAGHDLYKPHSGLLVNVDRDYVPDFFYSPSMADGEIPLPPKRKRGTVCGKGRTCYKNGTCGKRTCSKKKCRHIAMLKRREISKRIEKRNKAHLDAYYAKLGVTDGKLRSPHTHKFRDDQEETCGVDEIPKPEHVRFPSNLKRGALETHSLTVVSCTKDRRPEIHYGILTGTFNMYDNKFSARSRGRQALTMSVMAYCLAFHYHPKQWTMKLIDNLIEAGDKWFLQCADKVHDHSSVQGMCEVLPFGKKQTLLLNGKRMQILLGEPDIVGYTMSLDPTVYNLCRGLKAFFRESRAGILLTRVLKLVIWKDKICYYIFDPAGRDSKAYTNYARGSAALVNVKNLECVAEVLLARSIVEDQKFVLAPVKVLKMIDEKEDDDLESDKELTSAEKAMMGYRILNENCAIVNANMHLGDRCFEEAKYRQALPVSVMAMTYAKISPPNTWHTKTLDKILRLGNKLYVDCSNPKVLIDMTIDNIPNEVIVGPYACEIIIYRERVKGQLFTAKECILNIKTGLKDFFSKEYNSGILQFNNYSMAVWRQKDMYYLFDPYPRTSDGLMSIKGGKACVLMLLNPESMAVAVEKNWNYLPVTTQFYIHAFKVLKLKKKDNKIQLVCTLSDEDMVGKKVKRTVLPESRARGDGKELYHDVLPATTIDQHTGKMQADEEQMGDIVSLVDSIQEDYLPPIPLRYKNAQPEPMAPKMCNLDSPTVSVTQIVPPWPKPRDKSGEQPDLDPEPEPEPEPEPPPPPPPEGAEEEELGEEEEEERRRKEEEERKRLEEESKKALELPPPIPPPPPSPQPEPELANPPMVSMMKDQEDEIQTVEPVKVNRKILLTQDARYRHKLRAQRRKMTLPLMDNEANRTPSEELKQLHNFKTLLDGTEIIRGTQPVGGDTKDVLPFIAIMAIVTSYKYNINTWTKGVVTFVADSGKKLFANKKEKFQFAPMHVIPKIAIGKQAYQANIDVMGDGPTWKLEEILKSGFFPKHDRGMITTSNYSCAVFKKNGLYYLYDGCPTNVLGFRDATDKGNSCLMRFHNLHDLSNRVIYNKNGTVDDQQFILSTILVRRLLEEPRMKLPDDYDYETRMPKSAKSKTTFAPANRKSEIPLGEDKSRTLIGYQLIDGVYRIDGTTSLNNRGAGSADIRACHFVSLIAMLMAAMHPIRTWNHIMIDTAIEKGVEIYEKATILNVCEKRVIKNIILDGNFININIKKITVVNENPHKNLDQYLKAVLRRLRYVMIAFPQSTLVICHIDGFYHLFDPYQSAAREPVDKKDIVKEEGNASWTLYRTLDSLSSRLRRSIKNQIDNPDFYTFELTSVKAAPQHSALNYRLSPLFKPDENPNMPYLRRRRIRPTVDEKMYWLSIPYVPWSKMNRYNDLGFERGTPKTMWKDWNIEFPGDLYSLWGSLHPRDMSFDENRRGKQVLATCTVALAIADCCELSAWTSNMLDGVVKAGDKYYENSFDKLKGKANYELTVNDLNTKFDDMYPYSFTVKFEHVMFGFVYNISPDRFNLSKAMVYFFETYKYGILTSPVKNLAFGRKGASYFMFDCQSYGSPIFVPGQGSSYLLKCESLNRLVYCITITLNVKRHGIQFDLYAATVAVTEKK